MCGMQPAGKVADNTGQSGLLYVTVRTAMQSYRHATKLKVLAGISLQVLAI